MVQKWRRTLVEIYEVTPDADEANLLAAGRSTDYCGTDLKPRGYRIESGEMRVRCLRLSGGGAGPRILVRISEIDFEVTLERPDVPYEQIHWDVFSWIGAEWITEVTNCIFDLGSPVVDLSEVERSLITLHRQVYVDKMEPLAYEPDYEES